jgi:hypothetical protein
MEHPMSPFDSASFAEAEQGRERQEADAARADQAESARWHSLARFFERPFELLGADGSGKGVLDKSKIKTMARLLAEVPKMVELAGASLPHDPGGQGDQPIVLGRARWAWKLCTLGSQRKIKAELERLATVPAETQEQVWQQVGWLFGKVLNPELAAPAEATPQQKAKPPEKQPEPPWLPEHIKILRALFGPPMQTLDQYQLGAVLDMSRSTVGRRLSELRAAGMTYRPRGDRQGDALTRQGELFVRGLPPAGRNE